MIKLQGSQANRETNELIVEVFRLNGLLLSTADKLVSKFGLTGARWQVMGAIVQSDAPETTARLARNMGLTRQSVQRVVNDMVAEGLLVLADNPHHKRSRLVLMTPRGERAFQQALELQGPWVRALTEGIGKQRLREATDVLETIGRRLEAQGL